MRRAAVLSLVALLSLAATAACRGGRVTNAARTQTPPAATATDPNSFTGTVAETMNAGGYTYVRLQAPGKDDVWAAAREFPTKAGERLTVTLSTPMENFESKTLKRTFPLVYFVPDVTRDGQRIGEPVAGGDGTPALMASHAPASVATTVEPLAPPPDGISIEQLWAKRSALGGRQVTVRGKVVKVNAQILGRNWVHLQDGSGSAGDGTNDLTITTGESVKVGDVITVTGVLAIDKDFGAGYKYGAIVEEVKLVK